ncbi:MAG: hypothetical protein KGD66_10075 [Candidatus Lokiarchaeota archaeon]|nr:hypothetical protein [Candidatus Lokiarchaeota archaeon]
MKSKISYIVSRINNISILRKDLIEIEHEKVRSFTECPEFGERINNGFFMVTKHPTWNSSKQSLLFHYLTFHYLEDHEIYPEFIPVQNICYSGISKKNDDLNPRDKIRMPKIQAKEKITLDDLFMKLNEMIIN